MGENKISKKSTIAITNKHIIIFCLIFGIILLIVGFIFIWMDILDEFGGGWLFDYAMSIFIPWGTILIILTVIGGIYVYRKSHKEK